jgi:hypothetical protein
MIEFKVDWARLQYARAQQGADSVAGGGGLETANPVNHARVGLRH